MDQIKRLFANLTLGQKVSIGAAALAVIGLLVALSHWNKERDFKPVYTGLASEDAGQVLARLKESSIEYRLGDNGTSVLVPSGKVAELRLSLAASGLPKSGRIGFEIFDRTNFGASEFAEQINYHRALEGELERSIMSLAEVERARVHVTFPKDSIYTESKQPAKASVLLTLRTGAKLSPQNVTAICHLIASAVEGLLPEGVSVLDMRGNLLNRPRTSGLNDASAPSEATLEYRQQIERELLGKIVNTLEPMLGVDRFRAGVSVDCDFTSGEQSEESYDPSKSVMLTSQRTEDGAASASASGVPGTASNLPRPTSRPSSGAGGSSRRTESVTYASSRLVKHIKLPQGGIRRISVSVLLDHTLRFAGGKRIIEPPTPERVKVVRDLIAGVAGIVPERGDQIIVESSPFESTLLAEPLSPAQPASPPANGPEWMQNLLSNKQFRIAAGVGCGLLLALIAGVAFLAGRSRNHKKVAVQGSIEGGSNSRKTLAPPDLEKQLESQVSEHKALKSKQSEEILNSLRMPEITTKKAEVLVKQIQTEARKDPIAAAQVVRSWLTSSE
jgi:flagellar M-ring protein FliF